MTARRLLGVAGLLGALAVGLGAFGAHGLEGRVSARDLATFETAARYQLVHAALLVGLALWLERRRSLRLVWAARLLLGGVAIFSGSLYLLVLSGARWFGAVTPIGGVALIGGWLLVALAAGEAVEGSPSP